MKVRVPENKFYMTYPIPHPPFVPGNVYTVQYVNANLAQKRDFLVYFRGLFLDIHQQQKHKSVSPDTTCGRLIVMGWLYNLIVVEART